MRLHGYLILAALCPQFLWGAISYSIEFEGTTDPGLLKALKGSSELIALRKKAPASLNALRFRADSDVTQLTELLRSYGYFEGNVEAALYPEKETYRVVLKVDEGPLYHIGEILLTLLPKEHSQSLLSPLELQLCIGDGADTRNIADLSGEALDLLSQRGHPLANLLDQQIIADGKTKKVQLILTIDLGPYCEFGPLSIGGNHSVCARLVETQVKWSCGQPYDSCLVNQTQCDLIEMGLFTYAAITHADKPNDVGQLPMHIEVSEGKHKTVSLGASYQTTYGPEASIGWKHRNIGGMGRTLSIQADIGQRRRLGLASFSVPNFYCLDQHLRTEAEAQEEAITPYRNLSYRFLNRLDRQYGDHFFFSIGPQVEYLRVRKSVNNGNFFLAQAPFYLRWTNVEDFLNPKEGVRIDYRASPSFNFSTQNGFYYAQTLSVSGYLPLFNDSFVLAQKLTLGSIASDRIETVPVPNRFFGGSEQYLRGYKYYTISPIAKKGSLDEKGNVLTKDRPSGGRSCIFYSLEPRFCIGSFGLIPFMDIGKVDLQTLPQLNGKWFKSLGLGFCYYSFIGPIRLDVAFPLDRRKGLDRPWWVFVNVGQAF